MIDPLLPPEGEVVSEHAATWAGRIAALLFLCGGGAFLCFLGAQPDMEEARTLLFAIGAALLALGALAVVQQSKSRAVLRADGLERHGLRGKLWALRFADAPTLLYSVVKVRVGGLIGLLLPAVSTQIHVTLVDAAGKKRKLPINLKGLDVLAERVVDQHTGLHFPAARKALDAGEEVRFGKALTVDREKVSTRKLFGGQKSCPLAELEKFAVDGGVLKIRQRGKTFAFASIQTSAIPNVFILLRLLESLAGQSPSALQGRDFSSDRHVG